MGTKEFVLALAIVGAVAWTAKADGPAPAAGDLVVKGKLTVGGGDGRGSVVIGTLDGNPFVRLQDGRGVARANLEFLPGGKVSMNLASAKGDQRLAALVDEEGGGSVTTFAPDGVSYAEVRSMTDSVWFAVSDRAKKLRAVLGTLKGEEILRLLDRDGAATGWLGPK